MNRRVSLIVSSTAVLAVLASGCGSSDSDEGPSKASFIKKADALCGRVEKERGDAIKAFYDRQSAASPQQLGLQGQEKLVTTVALPPLKKMSRELAALNPPAGDEDEVDKIVSSLDLAIVQVEDNPLLVLESSSSPFREPAQLASKYGMKTCLAGY